MSSKRWARLVRASKSTVVGAILGLVVAANSGMGQAAAVLYFPPSLAFKGGESPQEGSDVQSTRKPVIGEVDSVAWAQEQLGSAEAVDMVTRRLERTALEKKASVLRSAVLLSDTKRISVTRSADNSIRLLVKAEDSQTASLLCECLLAYLSFKSKIPLEDPDPEDLRTSERELRVQEKSLANQLWSLMAFDVAEPGSSAALQSAALDLQDYQLVVKQYRRALHRQFFREPSLAASGPSFVVLEPATPLARDCPWGLYGGGGAACGLLIGMFALRGPRRSKNVPSMTKERSLRERTAMVES